MGRLANIFRCRGATGLTEREAALLGKYSSLHGLATMELASEHTGR